MKNTLTFFATALLLVGCATPNTPQGTYEGTVVSGGPTPIYTTFYDEALAQKENVNGLFMYKENNAWVTGSLTDCQFEPNQKATCHWQDKDGAGIMQVQFNERLDAFEGTWGTYCGTRADLTWTGIKTQNNPQ